MVGVSADSREAGVATGFGAAGLGGATIGDGVDALGGSAGAVIGAGEVGVAGALAGVAVGAGVYGDFIGAANGD